MSYASNFNLNWRVSYLESIISTIVPYLPLNLSNVLLWGNTADNSIVLTDGQNVSTSTKGGLLYQGNSPAPNTYIIDIDNAYGLGVPTISLQDNFSSISSVLNTSTGLVLNNGGLTTTYGNGLIDVTGVGMSIIAPNNNIYIGTNLLIDSANASTTFTTSNNFLVQTNSFQVENQNISTIGDINNNSSQTKFVLNASTQNIDIDLGGGNGSTGMVLRMGDINGLQNQTKITLDDVGKTINVEAPNGLITLGDPNGIVNSGTLTFDDANYIFGVAFQSTATVQLDSNNGVFRCGDVNIVGTGTRLELDDTTPSFLLNCQTPVKLNTSASVQYSTNYYTTNQSISYTSPYALTFNGASITATLPSVSAYNVGVQHLITNTNASSLTVATTGGQIIYSTTGASGTSKSLNTGHSQIFTAIRTTGSTTYGWSMV